ncbi:hypothetical protein BKA57DRAFT_531471 [Linnemannia elongata]|nr:hypothetical protein BKA57DRAFT_531471 [Linnemannia elongata]
MAIPQPTLPVPPRLPSFTTSSSSSSSSSHITAHFCPPFPATTKKHLLVFLRTLILLLSLTTLILDIATISFIHTHHRDFPLRFYAPSSSSSSLRDEAFIPLVLVPDITAIAIMVILLWESAHLRLCDRWWKWHVGARVLFGLVLVGVGAVEPSMEAVYYGQGGNGWKEYFCLEPTQFWRGRNGSGGSGGWSGRGGTGRFENIDRNGTYTGESNNNDSTNYSNGGTNATTGDWQSGNGNNNNSGNYYRTTNIQQCKLLRSRSILTFIWLLLVLLELLFAYSIGEFQSRSRRTRRGQQSRGLESATGNCGVGGGGGREENGTKRPASIVSSELWYEDRYYPNGHNNNQYRYNNDRILDRVEEIDYEEYEDEEEDDTYPCATSSRRTSSESSTSSGAFTLQEWSQSQPQHIDSCVEVPMQEITTVATTTIVPNSLAEHLYPTPSCP